MNRWKLLVEKVIVDLIKEDIYSTPGTKTPGTVTPGVSTPGISVSQNKASKTSATTSLPVLKEGDEYEFYEIANKLFLKDTEELYALTHYRNVVQDFLLGLEASFSNNRDALCTNWDDFTKSYFYIFATQYSLKKDLYKAWFNKINPNKVLPLLSAEPMVKQWMAEDNNRRAHPNYFRGISMMMYDITKKYKASEQPNLKVNTVEAYIKDEEIYAGVKCQWTILAARDEGVTEDDSNWANLLPPLSKEDIKNGDNPDWILKRQGKQPNAEQTKN